MESSKHNFSVGHLLFHNAFSLSAATSAAALTRMEEEKLRQQPIFCAAEALVTHCDYFYVRIAYDRAYNVMDCQIEVDLAVLHLAMATAIPSLEGDDVWPVEASTAFAQLYRLYHLNATPTECKSWKNKSSSTDSKSEQFFTATSHHMVPRVISMTANSAMPLMIMSQSYFQQMKLTLSSSRSRYHLSWPGFVCSNPCCCLKYDLQKSKGPTCFEFGACSFSSSTDAPESIKQSSSSSSSSSSDGASGLAFSSRFVIIDRIARKHLEDIVLEFSKGTPCMSHHHSGGGAQSRTMTIFCPRQYAPFWNIVCKQISPKCRITNTPSQQPVALRTRSRKKNSVRGCENSPTVDAAAASHCVQENEEEKSLVKFDVITIGKRSHDYLMNINSQWQHSSGSGSSSAKTMPPKQQPPDVVVFHNCDASFVANCSEILENTEKGDKKVPAHRLYIAAISSIHVTHQYKFLTASVAKLLRTLVPKHVWKTHGESAIAVLQHISFSAGIRYHNYFLQDLLFRKVRKSNGAAPQIVMRNLVVHLIDDRGGSNLDTVYNNASSSSGNRSSRHSSSFSLETRWDLSEFRPSLKKSLMSKASQPTSLTTTVCSQDCLKEEKKEEIDAVEEEEASESNTTKIASPCTICGVVSINLKDNLHATFVSEFFDESVVPRRTLKCRRRSTCYCCAACLVYGGNIKVSQSSLFSKQQQEEESSSSTSPNLTPYPEQMKLRPQARHWTAMTESEARLVKTLYFSFIARRIHKIAAMASKDEFLTKGSGVLFESETWIVFVNQKSMFRTYMDHIVPLIETRWHNGRASHLVKAHWVSPCPSRAIEVMCSAKAAHSSGVPLVILFCGYTNDNLSVYDIHNIQHVFCTERRIPDGKVWPRITDDTNITFLVESGHPQNRCKKGDLPRAPSPSGDLKQVTAEIVRKLHAANIEDLLSVYPG